MKALLSRALLAAVLAMGVTGCGASFRHSGRAVGLVAGLIVRVAIAEAESSSSDSDAERDDYYRSNGYYDSNIYDGPTPSSRSSARARVEPGEALPSFDPQAARVALNKLDVSRCRQAGAPSGFGHAKVTINPDGSISKVVVDAPAGLSAEAVTCIGDTLGTATVAPFKGSLVNVGTTYHID